MLSRQEMFDRAWNGLKSQNWEQAWENASCSYLTADGKRCAWGWVDPDGARGGGTVSTLHDRGMGLAASLTYRDLKWALKLQKAHDHNGKTVSPADLEQGFRAFAAEHGLSIPEER